MPRCSERPLSSSIETTRHLETCVTDVLRSGDETAAQESYDEIMGLLEKEL